MSNGRGNQEGQQDQDRQRGGKKGGGGGQPLTLTIDDVVTYNTTDQTLKASVLASRGTKTAAGIAVQFSVDGTPTGGQQTTNANGRAFLVLRGVAYQPGEHAISVEAVGEVAHSQTPFVVPREGEGQKDSPSLTVTSTVTQTETGFDLVFGITARRGEQPIQNTGIDVEWIEGRTPQKATRFTSKLGNASVLIAIPNPGKTEHQKIEIRFYMDDPPVATQQVVDLEWKEPKARTATVLEPSEASPGVYRVRVVVEGDEGKLLKGVIVSASGGVDIVQATTDEHGIADLTLTCREDEDMTTFMIDVPGIKDWKKMKLLGPHTRAEDQPKEEEVLPPTAPLFKRLRQKFDFGAGTSIPKRS